MRENINVTISKTTFIVIILLEHVSQTIRRNESYRTKFFFYVCERVVIDANEARKHVRRGIEATGDPDILDCDVVVGSDDIYSDGKRVLNGARASLFQNADDGHGIDEELEDTVLPVRMCSPVQGHE